MKFYSVLLFHLLLAVSLSAQNSVTVEQLIRHSESMLNQDPKASLIAASNAKALAEKNNDQKNLAAALSLMGVAYHKMDQYDTARAYINRSADISQQIKDTSNLTFCIYWLANLELDKGQYANALDSFELGYALADKTNDKRNLARCLDGEASIYETLNEDDKALEYYQKSLDAAQAVNFKEWYGVVVFSIGNLLYKKGQSDNAILKYNQAITFSKATNNLNNIGDCYQQLAYIYYYNKKDSKDAMKYVQQAMDIFQQTGSGLSRSYSRLLMSAILRNDKQYGLAIELATASLADGKEKNDPSLQKDAAEALYYAYLGKGDKSTALEYFVLFHKLSEISNERGMVQQLTKHDLTTKFDKERELTQAREAEMNSTLQKQKYEQEASIGIIILISIIALLAIYAYVEKQKDNRAIAKEKEKSDQLLLNILPSQIAAELKENGHAKARNYEMATVLFADIKNFTKAAEMMSPEKLVADIDYYFGNFDRIIAKYNIEKIKTIGDAYLCVGGLPVADQNNALYVVSAAIDLQDFVTKQKEIKGKNNETFFEIRIGIHSGPLVAGIVGLKKFAYDIWGDTVNVAARMEQYGEEGKINISGATYELIRDQFTCIHRGKIEAKNKGSIDMYFLEGKI